MSAFPEVALVEGSLVITDLHLDVEDERALDPFVAWLSRRAAIPRLLILGDLFEFWVGDAQLHLPGALRVVEALRSLVDGGTAIDVVPGNRDFLLGRGFERASGCSVHADGLVGVLDDGGRVLFLHGDELVSSDRGHMRLRAVLRSRAVRGVSPWVPRSVAFGVARRLRRASRSAKEKKAPLEMEMKLETCAGFATRHDAQVVVCGHAHRYRDVDLGAGRRFIILDAFDGKRGTLRVGEQGELEATRL